MLAILSKILAKSLAMVICFLAEIQSRPMQFFSVSVFWRISPNFHRNPRVFGWVHGIDTWQLSKKHSVVRVVDWVEETSCSATNCWPREYADNMSVYHVQRIVFLGEKFTRPFHCHSRKKHISPKLFCGFSKILVIFLCLCNLKPSKQTTLAAFIFMPGLDFSRSLEFGGLRYALC